MLKCKICNNLYHHLGSHIWHKHKTLAIEYKEMFGLDHKTALITQEIKEKKHEAFWDNPKKSLDNLKKGKKYYFKKGRTYIMGYVSTRAKKRMLLNLARINRRSRKLHPCPVCHIKYNHLESHLYNKHKLLKAK